MAAKARRRPVVSGAAAMIGASGEVIEFDSGRGWAEVGGERWRVTSDRLLAPHQRIKVAAMNGLTLRVSPEEEGANP
jgi:membrane-bound serine protease (ClpP class)